MKKNKKINMIIDEASSYYDEHDIFEENGASEIKGFRFELKHRKYVGVDVDLYSKITAMARRIHTTAEDLIALWLRQKVLHNVR